MICAWASPCAATLAAAAWPTDEDDGGGDDDEKVSRRHAAGQHSGGSIQFVSQILKLPIKHAHAMATN